MKVYKVVLSENAKNDIDKYIEYIYKEYKAPLTALRNYEGLFKLISNLSTTASSVRYCTLKSITDVYGFSCKRINYKKMAVIFSVDNEMVRVEAVLSQSLIKGVEF